MAIPYIPVPPFALSDPQMTQSMRTDFPAEIERSVVDGGVREGRPEERVASGFPTVAFLLIVLLVILALSFKWSMYGFP